jgi:DNA modification methylase
LRSYDTGDQKHAELGAEPLHDCLAWARGDDPCGACYVCNLREWAAEMWRVLRDDGCMFLNLGDSYASSGKAGPISDKSTWHGGGAYNVISLGRAPTAPGLKPKDLCGIPWRVALALQADGWTLRSDIIWAKPNPMPESVTDRPTKAHEYVFLLTKSPRYFWDAPEAVRENRPLKAMGNPGAPSAKSAKIPGQSSAHYRLEGVGQGTNSTAAATSAPSGTSPRALCGAHFATWPPALVERMVKAGTSERGVCPSAASRGGAWWTRARPSTRRATLTTCSPTPPALQRPTADAATRRWNGNVYMQPGQR